MKISDMYEGFQQGLRRIQQEEVGLITWGVDVGEDTILRRLLRRGSTTEVLNNGLDSSVIEAINILMK